VGIGVYLDDPMTVGIFDEGDFCVKNHDRFGI